MITLPIGVVVLLAVLSCLLGIVIGFWLAQEEPKQ